MNKHVRKQISEELTKWFNDNPRITKKEFANKLGVSSSCVIRWISMENAPGIELIPRICDIMNISVDQFLGHTSTSVGSEQKLLLMYRNDGAFKSVVDKIISIPIKS